jgi:glycosyltransferase involved in cell wall biosynthesis
MSRILIHSNAPWVPSGYGKQTAHLVRTLQSLGHEVVVSAFCGLTGAPMEWEGTTVLPSGQFEYGIDVLPHHMDMVKPDLTIMLMDVWKLGPIADYLRAQPAPVAAWVPVDCFPLSRLDRAFLDQSGVRPIAMSRFGERQLEEAGLDPLYAPHVVDRTVFRPLEADERADYREQMALDGKFVIGLCAANNDAVRKGFPEQLEAFRRFHEKHPESILRVHSVARAARGLDLEQLAGGLGIEPGSIQITDAYPQVSGMFDDSLLADWYGVLDVLTGCSYAEAFGVPLIEAQACGTPVVTTLGSAMTEVSHHGWGVPGDPFWNHVHGAWWMRPDVHAIVRAYEKAHAQAQKRRAESRTFTEAYDCRTAAETHWKGIVGELC